ncbi:phage portal protein [Paenibacillus flagellatus]|uniref:Phage portal protein n=2 Tax=Paenibacillus flagellatus TaxID=2211139 RepID=A0A2V5K0R8_9BACL|nr:phage portal protein [Paenibacillus flagellatus]
MAGYLPRYYETSRIIRSVLQTEGEEFDLVRETLADTLNQCFVRTSTWGLDVWEDELGLPPAPDQPVGERRDKIVSRLRGVGTATIRVVRDVAESYDYGDVEVMEDAPAYTVVVRFIDTLGAPPNIHDLKAAVRAVLPAHLQVEYAYKYLLVNQLHDTMTIDTLQTRKLTDFAPIVPV